MAARLDHWYETNTSGPRAFIDQLDLGKESWPATLRLVKKVSYGVLLILPPFFFHLEARRLLSNQASHPVQVSATEQGLFDSSFLIHFIQEVCLYQQPILLQGYLAVRQYD